MKKRRLLALGLAAAMTAGLIGCSTPTTTVETTAAGGAADGSTAAGGSTTAAGGEKIFRYSNKADTATIDPTKTNSVPDTTVTYHLYDGLYRNVMGDVRPATAKSHEVTEDGLVYTFHLRDDAKWSDGVSVTAKDFEYAMRRMVDPVAACPFSYLGAVLKNGAAVSSGDMAVEELGVKAIDDLTLEVTLENPAEYFLGMLSMSVFAPVRQDLVEKYGNEFGGSADKQVYNGPFKVTSYGGGKVVMAKNELFYDADSIKLDGVEVLTVADTATAVAMFEAGELDLVELSAELAPKYADKSQTYYSGANDYAALNHNNKYLSNKNLRLALNYGINREEYIMLANEGLYQANQRFVLPQVRGAEGEYGTEYPLEAFPIKGDMAKANEYLTTALSELGLSKPSELTLKLVVSDSDVAKKEAEVVSNQWNNNLGINVEISMVPYATRNAMLVPGSDEYDIIMSGWVPDYSDPYSYLELWYSSSGYNYLNYKSDAYDKYIDASKTTTGAERMENLFNAEKTMLEDGGLVPLQLRRVPYMVSDNVKNLGAYFIGLSYDYMYVEMME